MPPPSASESAPRWPLRFLYAAGLIVLFLGIDHVVHATIVDFWYNTLIRIGIYIVLSASLNLVNGVTGQFSLGHAAFMVIGAYTGGEISILAERPASHMPPIEAAVFQVLVFIGGTLAGAILAALAGMIVGMPTLRLRGDYLAIATLGFGEITRVLFQACEPLGGATGLYGVPVRTNLFWSLCLVTITLVMLRNLQHSGPGRDMLAVREDEFAAAAVGVDVVRTKVVAFIVAAAFAGAAGSLFIQLNNGITPQQAGFLGSIQIVVMVVLGGMGSLTGASIGAVILVTYHALIQGIAPPSVARYENVIYPVVLILLMLVRREGILGSRELSWSTFSRLFNRFRRTEKR